MRKLIFPAALFFIATAFVSCSGGNSPEKVVSEFITAISDRNWDAAKELSTAESESMIDMVKGFADMVPDTAAAFNFEVVKEKTMVEDESASVTIRDENSNEMAYKLKKIDGAWKVDFTMEALMGDMPDDIDMTLDDAMESMDETMEGMKESVDEVMDGMKESVDEVMDEATK
jgi:hypothetical protein